MNAQLLIENLTNPALLFFALGILAVMLRSDLEIPSNSSKFISLYLLFSIGFRGGQELAHETFTMEIGWSLLFGILLSLLIPVYTFFILRQRFNVYDSGAIAAAYGSISAVTFVTATAYLMAHNLNLHGHMVAVMALMEAPAIVSGLLLISMFSQKADGFAIRKRHAFKHAITNGSVMMIMGSLIIGYLASEDQAQGIKPFTTDLFRGFLAIFLLDMGIESGKKLKTFFQYGWFPVIFAVIIPLINGCCVTLLSAGISDDVSNRFMFGVLAASASYIAVPAALKVSVPQANPGIFLPMALAVTFPVNITIGLPLYFYLAGG
ncbi:MAG: sodium-dependent bicarbonate transport family permease [Cyclobacteriaceae bacterium]|nr:sodium-dependent bicarbonate transport family permease [Cyclobacteriaceae bacterium]MDW8330608.1 sodium-dependent bicarbonate transport family permease [Cyclobacteriaceae bacterium]